MDYQCQVLLPFHGLHGFLPAFGRQRKLDPVVRVLDTTRRADRSSLMHSVPLPTESPANGCLL